jgi:hypothetical protein
MDEARMKRLFYFSVSVLLAIVLAWIGAKLLLFTTEEISHTSYTVLGLLFIAGGIVMIGDTGLSRWWWTGASVVAIGIYCLARATDAIGSPLLAHFFGAACWLAGLILLYITWPTRSQNQL